MNKFHKVSFAQYLKDRSLCEEVARDEYDNIVVPKRATAGSAGYDFFAPFDFTLAPGCEIKFSTGIRVELDQDKFLACYTRSGLGFKYKLRLANQVGIIDADYYFADNEGHIGVKLCNEGNDFLHIKRGMPFMQGVITQYFLTCDDNATAQRHGGFGSTG